MDTCPKCAYQRRPADTDADPYLECPRCGIIFAKYARYKTAAVSVPAVEDAAETEAGTEPAGPWYLRLYDRLMELPENPDRTKLSAKALVLLVMIIWGVRLISYPWLTAGIMESFLHDVDLPIHEFGHVLFRPFGTWMMFLGGSLFQCLLPALIGIAFIWKMRDAFGAAFCLWWSGENVLDVAPYIGDAKFMALPLVGEWNDDVAAAHALRHDWHNILQPLGLINSAPTLASAAHTLGAAMMILSWVWAATWLWKVRQLSRSAAST